MKGFSVAEARARFGDLLDQAEQGDPVVIQRRGVRFILRTEPQAASASSTRFFEWLDPAVEAGDWTWDVAKSGMKFRSRRSTKKR
jgi:antitoxin (DNA-binding transcriptional repressor) of toxin-antitoxin stability system